MVTARERSRSAIVSFEKMLLEELELIRYKHQHLFGSESDRQKVDASGASAGGLAAGRGETTPSMPKDPTTVSPGSGMETNRAGMNSADESGGLAAGRGDTTPSMPKDPTTVPPDSGMETNRAGMNSADESEGIAFQQAQDMDLAGLALSGGGIRSATFGLGILQGLAHVGILKHFDYLSTVSGGGYIGSWLAAWIKREGDIKNVETQLKPNRTDQARAQRSGVRQSVPMESEPEPIAHLRAYSNYLAPKIGLFSPDTWVLAAIYLRNFLLNQMILFPFIMLVLLLARLYVWLFDLNRTLWLPKETLAGLAIVLLAVAQCTSMYAIWGLREISVGRSSNRMVQQINRNLLRALIFFNDPTPS
jgi:hypothetical protein